MFFLEKKYKMKDLYLGTLGYVTKSGSVYNIKKRGDEILFFKMGKTDDDDNIAINVFTGQKYFFFHGIQDLEDTIGKVINGYAIFNYVPLELCFGNQKIITEKELLKCYDDLMVLVLNECQKQEKAKGQNEAKEPITDSILQTILKTNELVKNSLIDEELKLEIVQELEELGEYYVNVMMNVDSGAEVLSLTSEYSIRMECMRKLTEIEDKFRNPEVVKRHTLKRQFQQFQKELK